ncbi:MAG: tetratricopeptide repeat protein [Deltaproteobacteria bacterium]|nr:tetratricopeptide repeat protein [Deltaproteobacteria bacterium]
MASLIDRDSSADGGSLPAPGGPGGLGLLLALLSTGCVALAQPPGTAPRPGFPVADPGDLPPRHHLRLQALEEERVILREWIRADGRGWQLRELVLDRRGILQTATTPEPAGAPPARQPAPAPTFPLEIGRHELRQERVGEHLRFTFARQGEAHATVLASLVEVPGLELVSLEVGPGRSPALAALSWRSQAAGAVVEGVEILDLRRGRAALALDRGLEHHAAGRYQESREHFRHAGELDPDFAEAAYDLACAEALLGAHDEAMRLLARAFELSPDRLRAVAEEDEDLAALRERPDWLPLLREGR